jgi:hypothetical protein
MRRQRSDRPVLQTEIVQVGREGETRRVLGSLPDGAMALTLTGAPDSSAVAVGVVQIPSNRRDDPGQPALYVIKVPSGAADQTSRWV